MRINVRLSEPGPFVMKVRAEGLPLKVAEIHLPEKPEEGFLTAWLLCRFREYFDHLPLEDLAIEVGQQVIDRHKKSIREFVGYVEKTSEAIDRLEGPISGDGCLFVNVSEDMRYKSLYSMINEKTPCLYLNMDLGFDREKREWRRDRKPFMPLPEFLQYLRDNRVGTVVTVNHYLVDRYRHDTGVWIVPLFKRLGVRLAKIENDPDDLRAAGYVVRRANYVAEWPTFSNLYCLSGWWDRRNGNCNIRPVAIPQDYRGGTGELRDGYRVAVLSNSRWDSVRNARNGIDALFGNMENPWRDLTTWYMAMRRMILGGDYTEHQRLHLNSRLHQFFWMAAQDLKYQAIRALRTERQVDVYGDVGWKNVCPEYYRGSLGNDEIEELFRRDDTLLLLANCSYTYLDASGPVYDMMRRGCRWVNLPVVAKTEGLKGMEAIEYDTPERLNELVNDIKPAFKKAGESLGVYRNLLRASVEEIIGVIRNESPERVWLKALEEHELELERVLDDYSDQNEILMRASLRMFR